MISSYLCDKINIINTSYDEWGKVTKTVQTNINARVEENNDVVMNQEGQQVIANSLVLLPSTAIINYQSKIKIISRGGVTQSVDREYQVKKIGLLGGFKASQYEVYI